MPRTFTIEKTVYLFNELDDQAKEEARDWYRQGALDYDWWNCIYEDAKKLGFKITSFDLNNGGRITGKFNGNIEDSCKDILKDYIKDSGFYEIAEGYLEKIDELKKRYLHLEHDDDDTIAFEEALDDLTLEFKQEMLEGFLSSLKKEEEFQLSEEQVDEAIEANGYKFTREGYRG